MKKKTSLLFMLLLYLAAGINHFINPDFYTDIMPQWLPDHELLNTLAGISEIVLAGLLLLPQTQRFSACMILLMLVVFFFCIHVPMALDFRGGDGWKWWITIARLPIQYVLARWTLRFTRGKMVYFWKNTPAA